MSIFVDSVMTDVFYELGTFTGGMPRFARAPFKLLKIPGSGSFVVPNAVATDPSGLWDDDTFDEVEYQARDGFGFHSLERVVIGEHQMGDLSDTWMGVHRFSFL